MTKNYYRLLIKEIIEKKLDLEHTLKLRRSMARELHPAIFPSLIQILLNADETEISKLRHLITKPTRTISGVAPVAVMTMPIACPPQARCTYCPGGPNSVFGSVPKAYTGREPATLRAIRNDYDPYLQIFNRLEQYLIMGLSPSKVEIIIMGGTFTSFPDEYQDNFVKFVYKAMNDFGEFFFKAGNFDFIKFKEFFELPADINDAGRMAILKSKMYQSKGSTELGFEKKRNETAAIRCVGLTIETRPDCAMLHHANTMLAQGATRIEVGIQSVYDAVLTKIKRGHTVNDTIESIRILKDLGFKINAHYMLGLPDTDLEMDLSGLKELFSNPDFRPDMLKIYPCMVMSGTELCNDFKDGLFEPMTTKAAINVLKEFKKDVPKYLRIMRVQRDIPTNVTEAGVDRTNLRQYLANELKAEKIRCRCIRCRESGRAAKIEETSLLAEKYDASHGVEYFISIEDTKNDVIIGFCRMRFPSQSLRSEITDKTALIRELHVYSPLVEIGKLANKYQHQHRGFGKMLLNKAEEIAVDNGKDKMVVISGVGVREYYYKHGYKEDGPYVSKALLQ